MHQTYSLSTKSAIHLLLLLAGILLSGCASVSGPPEEHDPFESYNRAMYKFNDTVDRAVFKPVAETYKDYVPDPVQTGVSNFFGNLGDVVTLFNDLLQGKFAQAASDFSRIVWNSTLGVLGLFDVASHMELPKHDEDFGQTLAVWGVGDGPYLVLPFLGPSTMRDTGGLVVDIYTHPLSYPIIEDDAANWAAVGLAFIDKRVELLTASKVLDEAALDPYLFMREAYLQLRQNKIYDGNPPQEKIDLGTNGDEDLDLELELELEMELDDSNTGKPATQPSVKQP
ncbi:MAG: VacJ family lipoprotein [Gammaproteobacteria bacterium]|nr:VacJ family lipoprotein [Gammaproteobacteria bacterium]